MSCNNCQTCRASARSRWVNVNAVVTAIRQHLEEGHPDVANMLLLRLEALTLKEANRFTPIVPAETRCRRPTPKGDPTNE